MTVRWAIFGAVIGAILGSIITAGTLLYTSTKAQQGNTARELLSEVVALVSLQEGWLLQDEGSQTAKLSDFGQFRVRMLVSNPSAFKMGG
jgi:hypothetical protein